MTFTYGGDPSTVSRDRESSVWFRMRFLCLPYNSINMTVAITEVKQAKDAMRGLGATEMR
jgi:hypothetical protein